MPNSNPDNSRQDVLYGIIAYTIWGSFPVFFKALHGAAPLEIVSHRIFWSAVFLCGLLIFRHQFSSILTTIRDRGTLLTLFISTLLISGNWLTFLFAIERGEVLQSSLAYFITPLISVLLGFIFLRERLNRWQTLSLLLATAGVFNLTFQHGQIPWLALIMAFSFGCYGLLRKLARVDATVGLTVETSLLAPIALCYIIFLGNGLQGHFLSGEIRLDILLPLSGVVTAIPLLLFVAAARRLQLTTIGFLQYITPSLHFLLAIGVYREPFSSSQLTSFLFIWAGLAVYSANAILSSRAKRAAAV
ncbi:chloramphenicol-sensitive protein RarD [Malonomonas rubra DSM 5091]|uniref:Chloramphenicol-sensitive protein RarD n=1 Tax=Malonomonas rubra DSM 5091 TaxID=1122189 RepID=A0A1M6EUZ7_MALRU|nr:EamA family transporter RarD [Malonomonas rubra]SHI89216.1 chloramphenicol-sensitive protein RarD [Malonomonas rubra DSM 5091]